MRLFLFICFSFFVLTSNAQEKNTNSVSVSVDARKMDYFFGLSYHLKNQNFHISFGVETGIIKTAFQQRLFPGIHAQIAYPLVKRQRFSFGPAFGVNYNLLQIEYASNQPNLFQEYRLGYDLKWGNKLKFVHSAGLGIISEHYYGAYSQKYLTALDLGYSVKIGCLYEF